MDWGFTYFSCSFVVLLVVLVATKKRREIEESWTEGRKRRMKRQSHINLELFQHAVAAAPATRCRGHFSLQSGGCVRRARTLCTPTSVSAASSDFSLASATRPMSCNSSSAIGGLLHAADFVR
jgi:hypothetical protein